MKKYTLILSILLLSQVKGAYASLGNVSGYMSPATKTISVGETFSAKIMINSGSYKLSGINISLNIDSTKLKVKSVVGNTSAFGTIMSETSVNNIVNLYIANLKSPSELPSGVIEIGTVILEGVQNSTVVVDVKNNWELVGPSTVDDVNYTLVWQNASYTVGSVINGTCNSNHYTCATGNLGDYLEYPNSAYPDVSPQWQWWCKGSGGGTNILCSELKTTEITGNDYVLNYKVALANVNPNSAKCVISPALKFMVNGGNQSKTYADVLPQTREAVGTKLVFGGSLALTGFTETNNVAVFVSGPKHLQTKYGRANQSTMYDKAGGELTLTKTNTPVYDFSNYPMLAGDVVSNNSQTSQDGNINGVDFAYVKSKSLVHETVAEGGYLRGDLNGDCQVNSNDVNIMKISLQDKQGQLY